MNITFPYPATSGQTYTAENGVLYYYDGTKWISQGQGGGGGTGNYGNANVAAYLPTYSGDLGNVGNITSTGNISANNFYIGNTLFTRTLTVGTDTAPVTVPLASNNSLNVLTISGNVVVYTT
jgi:hypothetical protein